MIKINGKEFEYHLFPNNEIQIEPVELIENYDNVVSLRYDNSIDLIMLQLIKKDIDNRYPMERARLEMLYIPYERMDRQTKKQMCTCKYICEIINDMMFDTVTVLDPHSNVSAALLNNVIQVSIEDLIYEIMDEVKIDGIFMPDVGAYKKYSELLEDVKLPKFWGNKHRDLETGAITDYDIIGNIDVKDKNILIVDDICVKGYTTLFGAKKLKELGANKVYFYCSHCEDNIHAGQLLKTDYVDHIYTTNSLRFDEHDKITILNTEI